MSTTPFLRHQMLEIVRDTLLPWAREAHQNKRLLLLQPPLRLPPGVPVTERIMPASQMRRGRPTPGRGSFTSYVMWPELGLHTIPFAWLGFLYRGEADLRLGATRSLVCGPQGEGKVQIVALEAPTFFVIPPGVPHPDGSRLPWERPLHLLRHPPEMFWIHVSPAGLRCHIARVAGEIYQEEFFLLLSDERLTMLARLLIAEMSRPQRFDLIVEATLQTLLLNLEIALDDAHAANADATNDNATDANATQENRSDPNLLNGRIEPTAPVVPAAPLLPNVLIEAALRFIESHLNWRTLSSQAVAAHAHVSSSHLNRLFKAELGVTIKGYIRNARVDLAKSLLRDSDIPIAEVGFLAGFFPPSHFTRAFSQTAGCSPKQFRDTNRTVPDVLHQ